MQIGSSRIESFATLALWPLFSSMPTFTYAANLQTDPVQIEGGLVSGTAGAKPEIRVFKGVPYASPPVGALRWKEPQPVIKWSGVRPAVEFGSTCMQLVSKYRPTPYGMSEDCLHLNIWVPAQSQTKPAADQLPVMVWFHGSGLQDGASTEPRYDGESLASKGVIVVTVNYRLGVFGFLAHPALTRESSHHASGNYGFLDQVQALRWVHQNIAVFGGNPSKVTIFGHSGGSFSVSALMASPLTRGLIAGAIGESGSCFGPLLAPKKLVTAEDDGVKFAARHSALTLADLRALPAEQLVEANTTRAIYSGPPVIDGYFLPGSPKEIYAAGKQQQIPLLAGWNSDEVAAGIISKTMTPQKLSEHVFDVLTRYDYKDPKNSNYNDYAPDAGPFLAAYAAKTDEDALLTYRDLLTDEFYGYSAWKWIELHARSSGKPVYRYLLTHLPPRPKTAADGTAPARHLGAPGSSDIEYVFGTLESNKRYGWRPEDLKLSELIQTYWTNFAKSGDPNGPGLPQWDRSTSPGGQRVMNLDVDARCGPDQHLARYLAFDRIYSKNVTPKN